MVPVSQGPSGEGSRQGWEGVLETPPGNLWQQRLPFSLTKGSTQHHVCNTEIKWSISLFRSRLTCVSSSDNNPPPLCHLPQKQTSEL